MKLKFFNPAQLDKNLRATIHKTGKLGFTVEAANKLRLSEHKGVAIGMNEDDIDDDSLYMVLFAEKQDNSFQVSKAGDYYYVNTKALFEKLKYDYENESYVFMITEEIVDGQTIYKFTRKETNKKSTERKGSTLFS